MTKTCLPSISARRISSGCDQRCAAVTNTVSGSETASWRTTRSATSFHFTSSRVAAPAGARHEMDQLLNVPDDPIADDVRLAASELVTNVIRHTADGGELRARDLARMCHCGWRSKTPTPHSRRSRRGPRPLEDVG